jgi:hypothetical protein
MIRMSPIPGKSSARMAPSSGGFSRAVLSIASSTFSRRFWAQLPVSSLRLLDSGVVPFRSSQLILAFQAMTPLFHNLVSCGFHVWDP